MQHSVVDYSKMDVGDRIDAEYFQPAYLHLAEELVKRDATPLRNFCSYNGERFLSSRNTSLSRRVICHLFDALTAFRILSLQLRQDGLFEKVPTYFADQHQHIKRLSKGEIVITKVGTPCYASIIHDIDDVALSRTVLGLKSITGIDPYYLVAFLRSKYGFYQLFRERELTIQYQLTLERVSKVLIFKPTNDELEKGIAGCILLSEEISAERQDDYLPKLKPSSYPSSGLWTGSRIIVSISSPTSLTCNGSGRIDADYFQPKYAEIVNSIKDYAQADGATLWKI